MCFANAGRMRLLDWIGADVPSQNESFRLDGNPHAWLLPP